MKNSVLKGKLTEKGVSYKKCSDYIGISITAFSNKINGIASFKVTEAQALSDYLELNSNERANIFLN